MLDTAGVLKVKLGRKPRKCHLTKKTTLAYGKVRREGRGAESNIHQQPKLFQQHLGYSRGELKLSWRRGQELVKSKKEEKEASKSFLNLF